MTKPPNIGMSLDNARACAQWCATSAQEPTVVLRSTSHPGVYSWRFASTLPRLGWDVVATVQPEPAR